MNKFKPLALLMVVALAINPFNMKFENQRSRTPHIGGHSQHPKFRPHIPDGKWVMRHHRSRH